MFVMLAVLNKELLSTLIKKLEEAAPGASVGEVHNYTEGLNVS